MAGNTPPSPPDTLPQYLQDGLPKQDLETLEDTQEYIDELIAQKAAPLTESDLPENADPVDDVDGDGSGTIVKEMVKCGKSGCKCASGELHGPYLYRYYRDESGSVASEYIGKPE